MNRRWWGVLAAMAGTIMLLWAGNAAGRSAAGNQASVPDTELAPVAADNVVVRLSPEVKGVANCYDCPGGFELNGSMSNVSSLAEIGFTLCFDPAALQVGQVVTAGLTQGFSLGCSQSPGCVTCNGRKTGGGGNSGQGAFLTLAMTRTAGSFPTRIEWRSVTLKDAAGQTIPSSSEGACIASGCLRSDVWRSCDCRVDVADVLTVAGRWLCGDVCRWLGLCRRCDINGDGNFGWEDVQAAAGDFGQRCPACAAPSGAGAKSAEASPFVSASGNAAAVVFVEPATLVTHQGDSFSIEVKVTGARELYGFQFALGFDPRVLQFEAAELGGFLQGDGEHDAITLGPAVDEAAGSVLFGGGGLQGVSGDGTLARLRFEAIGLGRSGLDLSEVDLCTLDFLHLEVGCEAPGQVGDGYVAVTGCVYLPLAIRRR